MKKFESLLIGVLISFSIAYLLGAFFSATFNISEWTENVRFSTILSGMFFSVIYAGWIESNNI